MMQAFGYIADNPSIVAIGIAVTGIVKPVVHHAKIHGRRRSVVTVSEFLGLENANLAHWTECNGCICTCSKGNGKYYPASAARC